MQTKNLIGAALDWAVATCEGLNPSLEYTTCTRRIYIAADTVCALTGDIEGNEDYSPSTDWAQGGPIIEREAIQIFRNVGGTYSARIRHEEDHPLVAYKVLAGFTNSAGPTMLVAAMRCFVASKLGENIELPEELK